VEGDLHGKPSPHLATLQTVEETQQIATATALEVDAQGKKLDKLDPQLHLVSASIILQPLVCTPSC
jgi:hypothetical protein